MNTGQSSTLLSLSKSRKSKKKKRKRKNTKCLSGTTHGDDTLIYLSLDTSAIILGCYRRKKVEIKSIICDELYYNDIDHDNFDDSEYDEYNTHIMNMIVVIKVNLGCILIV